MLGIRVDDAVIDEVVVGVNNMENLSPEEMSFN
jgi:hypothetical protein